MREILNLNYGIYEYDIMDLGGEIQWSGRVVSKMRHSVLEDAVIILGDIHCEARFERYDFGNAAICCFVCVVRTMARIMSQTEFKVKG